MINIDLVQVSFLSYLRLSSKVTINTTLPQPNFHKLFTRNTPNIMASILESILACLLGTPDDHTRHIANHIPEKQPFLTTATTITTTSDDHIAADLVNILRTAQKTTPQLHHDLNSTVAASTSGGGWTEGIARAVLNRLVDLVSTESREKLGPAVREALERADEVASGVFGFARDHPVAVAVFCTVLAVGVLWFMAPWVLEVLGYAAEGPVEGEFRGR